ncbi:MAG: hypothetical protein A2Y97_09155 [Nitrospirae bacterium RBG_13_39_12]|nr:MAG: hypothetical protein A2Y97_09155 [Nitrospirae bacterium RBG_13_39_12]
MKRNIILIFGIIILLSCIYIAVELIVPLPVGSKNIEIQIPDGCTFKQAGEILSKEGLMRDKNLFIFIGRITGLDRRIRAGYYSITGSVNLLDIFNMFKKGQIIEYEITILEGDSLREISEKLLGKGIIDKEEFMKLSSDEGFLSFYDIDAPTFEGYLYPDTYKIPKGTDPEEVIGMMINKMRESIPTELYERASEIGLSERQLLTLASIIEKEAVTDRERPIISAVYHNRLKKGIKLQADPTAIYGVKSFKEKITAKDVRRKTKYNTYVKKGLPPGPIASPGYKSIVASAYPSDVPYLYFVSNNDGTHHFSVTAKEHEAAVKEYRKKKEMEKKLNEKNTEDDEES